MENLPSFLSFKGDSLERKGSVEAVCTKDLQTPLLGFEVATRLQTELLPGVGAVPM